MSEWFNVRPNTQLIIHYIYTYVEISLLHEIAVYTFQYHH